MNMKNILFPLVTIVSVLLFSCSNNDNEPTPATKAAISGSVILYDEGTSLLDKSNMNVKVLGTTPLIQTTTKAEGKFVLPEVPFGTYTLEYSKTGFGSYKKKPLSLQPLSKGKPMKDTTKENAKRPNLFCTSTKKD